MIDVTYNEVEVDSLTEARRMVIRLETDLVYCYPAWRKLYNVNEYLSERQREEVAEALADPEAK